MNIWTSKILIGNYITIRVLYIYIYFFISTTENRANLRKQVSINERIGDFIILLRACFLSQYIRFIINERY